MKKYDPILCMMVEDNSVKTNDALDKSIKNRDDMYMLLQNGKAIKAFQSVGAPLNEAKKYIKEKGLKGVFILGNNKTNGSFTINSNDALDNAIRNCDEQEVNFYNKTIPEARSIVNQKFGSCNERAGKPDQFTASVVFTKNRKQVAIWYCDKENLTSLNPKGHLRMWI